MAPPPTTPATNSTLSSGSDACRISAVTDGADATAGMGAATVGGVVLRGDGAEVGITSNRGVVLDVDRGRSRSPPASGGLAAADATVAVSVVTDSDGGAALDTSLSREGRDSPDVDSQ